MLQLETKSTKVTMVNLRFKTLTGLIHVLNLIRSNEKIIEIMPNFDTLNICFFVKYSFQDVINYLEQSDICNFLDEDSIDIKIIKFNNKFINPIYITQT